ncbi:putative pre-16S rRNA nuclease [Porphyridium purpureum]|uniref:Putative pre-16S rRNA nuclease n=1 Tax=Porphyridium purpureum TaxID=35688 RepID=A0A5J4YT08_PORPP|nr:putative pre-16S rRNA nuclease [Porphyridium purpureum]|eukprot:POR4435..scf229_5
MLWHRTRELKGWLDAVNASRGRSRPVLGIDYGTWMIGLAVSDPTWRFVFPRPSIVTQKSGAHFDEIAAVCKEHDVGSCVVGYPVDLRGQAGARCLGIERFVESLAQSCAFDTGILWDERFSSVTARKIVGSAKLKAARKATTPKRVKAATKSAIDQVSTIRVRGASVSPVSHISRAVS